MVNQKNDQAIDSRKVKETRKSHLLPILSILIFFIAAGVASADTVIINSKDWQDVYSSVQYAKLNEYESRFIVSEKSAINIIKEFDTREQYILIQGIENYASGYKSILQGNSLSVEEYEYDLNLNLDLAKDLYDNSNIRNFILIDGRTGYDSLSAAALAVVSKSFVIFTDPATISDVVDFLQKNKPNEITIIGSMRREVQQELQKLETDLTQTTFKRINEGSRFENNIKIAEEYLKYAEPSQIIITNGEFIEDELMKGTSPLIFIGTDKVPDDVKKFIEAENFTYAVLIGNNLITTATYIKREMGLIVFVKFAKSNGGSAQQFEELDKFYVPRHALAIEITNMKYNLLTNQLEVTYRNLVEQASYFLSTIEISDNTIGDESAVFIDGFQEKTITYDINLTEDIFKNNSLASIYTLYGETKDSLELALEQNISVSTIKILDESEIIIEKIIYDKIKQAFLITISNPGSDSVFTTAEIVDILIDTEKTTITSPVTEIKSGNKKELVIRQKMNEFDLADNPELNLRILYGAREDSLIKQKTEKLPLEIKLFSGAIITGGVVLILALIIIASILLFFRRRKKKEPQTPSVSVPKPPQH